MTEAPDASASHVHWERGARHRQMQTTQQQKDQDAISTNHVTMPQTIVTPDIPGCERWISGRGSG